MHLNQSERSRQYVITEGWLDYLTSGHNLVSLSCRLSSWSYTHFLHITALVLLHMYPHDFHAEPAAMTIKWLRTVHRTRLLQLSRLLNSRLPSPRCAVTRKCKKLVDLELTGLFSSCTGTHRQLKIHQRDTADNNPFLFTILLKWVKWTARPADVNWCSNWNTINPAVN